MVQYNTNNIIWILLVTILAVEPADFDFKTSIYTWSPYSLGNNTDNCRYNYILYRFVVKKVHITCRIYKYFEVASGYSHRYILNIITIYLSY